MKEINGRLGIFFVFDSDAYRILQMSQTQTSVSENKLAALLAKIRKLRIMFQIAGTFSNVQDDDTIKSLDGRNKQQCFAEIQISKLVLTEAHAWGRAP